MKNKNNKNDYKYGIFYFNNYYISREPDNLKGKFWIGDRTMVRTEISIKKFEKILDKFYKDNF
jgi:hypothetical protein